MPRLELQRRDDTRFGWNHGRVTNERLAVSSADASELEAEALEEIILRRALSLVAEIGRDETAVRLGILSKVGTRYAPTLVGLYALGKVPQHHFPEWGVGCAAFAGTTLVDPIEAQADLEGRASSLAAGAIAFVRERCGGVLTSESAYDETTLREAIINALVHRDLRRPSRVALRVFTDRVEVWSPGGPPEGVGDLEELGREGGISQPRNPLLASIMRQLGHGEQIGRGLALMLQSPQAPLERRVEVRASARDVMVVLPSRWQRPRAALS